MAAPACHSCVRRSERGVFAILAAAGLSVFLLLLMGMAELGLTYVHLTQQSNAAEALAMANGMRAMTVDSPNSTLAYAMDTTQLRQLNDTNTADSATITISPVPANLPKDGYTLLPQANLIDVSISGPHKSLMPLLYTGAALHTESVHVNAAISQYQANTPTLVPARILLLLDYSDSMKVSLQAGSNSAVALPAITLLKQAAATLLTSDDLSTTVNWGFLPFSDVPRTDKAVQPLACDGSAALDPASLRAHALAVNAQVQSTDTLSGANTNMSKVLTQAKQFVAGGVYPNVPSINCVPPIFVLVSDGEPSDDGSGTTDTASYPQRVNQARLNATADVQTNAAQPTDISVVTVLIDRQVSSVYTLAQTGADFMRGMACRPDNSRTNCGQAPASYMWEAHDTTGLNNFAQLFPVDTHYTTTLPSIAAGSLFPLRWSSTSPMPISGFWVPSTASGQETLAEKVAFLDLDRLPANATATQSANLPPRFFFDPVKGTLIFNQTISHDYAVDKARGTNKWRFRLRWGYPVLNNFSRTAN